GKIECKATAELPDVEDNLSAEVTIYHLPLEQELAYKLHDNIKRFYDLFKPVGTAKIQLSYETKKAQCQRNYVTFEPDEIDACFQRFPYPLERIPGFLDYDFLKRTSRFEMVGYSGEQPIKVWGTWKGGGINSDAVIEISGDAIPLDQKLLDALSPGIQKVAS